MNRPPFQMGHAHGPGPAAAEARTRAIRARERHDYAAMTDRLWTDAWDPPRADGRGPLALALDTAAAYAAGRRTI